MEERYGRLQGTPRLTVTVLISCGAKPGTTERQSWKPRSCPTNKRRHMICFLEVIQVSTGQTVFCWGALSTRLSDEWLVVHLWARVVWQRFCYSETTSQTAWLLPPNSANSKPLVLEFEKPCYYPCDA